MKLFEGLVAAPFAPYDKEGNVDYNLIEPYVDHLVKDGLKGIFVNGSNGEGPNLTIEERLKIAEVYKAVAGDRIKLIVHVGHSSIRESVKLAIHAARIKADAVSSVAAFYFKPADVRVLVDSMAAIAKGAPDLPFYYYHIPQLTNVGMDMLRFLELGARAIPNLQGIKYTAPTIHEFQACLNHAGNDFEMLWGTDEMLLSALAVGARGAIGSTFNFAAPLYHQVIKAFHNGDLDNAKDQQSIVVEMVRVILAHPPIPAQKAIMKMIGLDLGGCRLPLPELGEKEYQTIHRRLTDLHFFERLNSTPVLH